MNAKAPAKPSSEQMLQTVRSQMTEGKLDIAFQGTTKGKVVRSARLTAEPSADGHLWIFCLLTGDGGRSIGEFPAEEAEGKILEVLKIIDDDFSRLQARPN